MKAFDIQIYALNYLQNRLLFFTLFFPAFLFAFLKKQFEMRQVYLDKHIKNNSKKALS